VCAVARNAGYTKEYNRKLILRLLRLEPMSRAEIARRTGLTRACTSLIAADMLEEGMLRELEPVLRERGRAAIPLALRGDAAYAVGVYLNRDGCTAGIVDIAGGILVQERIRLEDAAPGGKIEPLARAIGEMLERTGIAREKLCGIGVSAPGPLNGEEGRILNPTRFGLWHQTEIGPMLRERTGFPVFLENNAACLARYYYGRPESRGSGDFLLLLVDSGVGSGVISGGKVFRSSGDFTSEIGHMSIRYDGIPCPCGNVGCLEMYAAIPNLLRGTGFSAWAQVVDAADTSAPARALLVREADYLGAGIVSLANLISIDTVLLAGDILYGAGRLAPLLESRVNARAVRRERQQIRVLPSSLEPGVRLLSAADVAFGRTLLA